MIYLILLSFRCMPIFLWALPLLSQLCGQRKNTFKEFVAEAVATSALWIKSGTRILATSRAEIAGDIFIMACSHCSRNGILFEVAKKKGWRIYGSTNRTSFSTKRIKCNRCSRWWGAGGGRFILLSAPKRHRPLWKRPSFLPTPSHSLPALASGPLSIPFLSAFGREEAEARKAVSSFLKFLFQRGKE